MIMGVISDIHSNWEALEVVFKFLEEKGVKEILCCGDVVGYGPDPERCIELITTKGIRTVAGNHDWAVTGKASLRGFNPVAGMAIRWTRSRLNTWEIDFLNNLPLTLDKRNLPTAQFKFMIVHAGPHQLEKWGYIFTVEDAAKEFYAFTEEVCFIGHSHIPFIVEIIDEEIKFITPKTLQNSVPFYLRREGRYLINVGSVGQPRDGDPRACCLLIEPNERWVSFHRLSYEYTITQRKMRSCGLPELLAERLAFGK